MHLMKAIASVVTSIFTLTVVHGEVLIRPLRQTSLDVVLIRKDAAVQLNSLGQNRLARSLLDMLEHVSNDLTLPLDQAQDRRLFAGQRAPSWFALEPSAWTSLLRH